ncbi:3-oxoacyl- domain protein [Campylobacter jejuni subsp. jejuni DFVF1099]|nr:3-oxoacyl- domain protein [Campylobacter jejuni subsp. jejuni DFVF1099]
MAMNDAYEEGRLKKGKSDLTRCFWSVGFYFGESALLKFGGENF